jgi:putative zinc finger/helix-turn-helix YgiT family protein
MKPFPWKCATCGERALAPQVLDYTAEFEHDGRPYQFVVPKLPVLQCRKCKAIVLDDEANRKVTEAFRTHAGLLTPEQIRAFRHGLGLSQEQLAACLKVSNSTVSRWETGAQIQQRAMDALLRTFFQVPEARRFLGLMPGDGKAPEAETALSTGS